MIRALKLNPEDDVAILLDAASPGDEVSGTIARQQIASGHKLATRSIAAGAPVHKYGQVIG
ncbi:MAG TPA: altronate dehydratase, partial [Sphingomicrobium sp.]